MQALVIAHACGHNSLLQGSHLCCHLHLDRPVRSRLPVVLQTVHPYGARALGSTLGWRELLAPRP